MKSATRSTLLIALLLGLVSFSQAATKMVAPVAPVTLRDAMSDATTLASLHANAKVMKISGTSMHPFFGDGTLIVVKPISESKLRVGMVVVYRNRFGETVAHRLVSRQNDSWIAKGYNNAEVDSTPVNGSNLVGVVYATFHTASSNSESLASLNSSIDVALAASAK
ncbi:MAG: signal peptidase I [Opitutaceae bacterium]|jgi:signal peptidase I